MEVQTFLRTTYTSSPIETLDETTNLISKALREGI